MQSELQRGRLDPYPRIGNSASHTRCDSNMRLLGVAEITR